MRRKKKFGVYTNASIKRCSCNYFCTNCKSLCKAIYREKTVPVSAPHDTLMKTRKTHQFGYGSLMPGKKFIIFNKKYHYRSGKKTDNYWTNAVLESLKKEYSKNFIIDEIDYWKFLDYCDAISE